MSNKEIIDCISEWMQKSVEHIWDAQDEKSVMAFKKPCQYPVFSEKDFCDELANELFSVIAPVIPGFYDLGIGAKIEVVAKLDHKDDTGHSFKIGHIGKITEFDKECKDLCYKVDGAWWVSRTEIKPIDDGN